MIHLQQDGWNHDTWCTPSKIPPTFPKPPTKQVFQESCLSATSKLCRTGNWLDWRLLESMNWGVLARSFCCQVHIGQVDDLLLHLLLQLFIQSLAKTLSASKLGWPLHYYCPWNVVQHHEMLTLATPLLLRKNRFPFTTRGWGRLEVKTRGVSVFCSEVLLHLLQRWIAGPVRFFQWLK